LLSLQKEVQFLRTELTKYKNGEVPTEINEEKEVETKEKLIKLINDFRYVKELDQENQKYKTKIEKYSDLIVSKEMMIKNMNFLLSIKENEMENEEVKRINSSINEILKNPQKNPNVIKLTIENYEMKERLKQLSDKGDNEEVEELKEYSKNLEIQITELISERYLKFSDKNSIFEFEYRIKELEENEQMLNEKIKLLEERVKQDFIEKQNRELLLGETNKLLENYENIEASKTIEIGNKNEEINSLINENKLNENLLNQLEDEINTIKTVLEEKKIELEKSNRIIEEYKEKEMKYENMKRLYENDIEKKTTQILLLNETMNKDEMEENILQIHLNEESKINEELLRENYQIKLVNEKYEYTMKSQKEEIESLKKLLKEKEDEDINSFLDETNHKKRKFQNDEEEDFKSKKFAKTYLLLKKILEIKK
jgi:hypothetical protein